MPETTETYYSSDNFFKKMTDLESPRKNNDCYFYYYSTCAKGDNCTFRHEPSALGCETMCSFWKEGKCLNVHCNFRHMELRKNRKAIQCYWETQPGGCLKSHCPFMHQNPRPGVDDSIDSKNDSGTESADNTMNEKMNQLNEKNFKNPPVDSLVVNFEEESDNESAPTYSPIKPKLRPVKVKTLEEIKLEKIQAESAAYYSYTGAVLAEAPVEESEDSGDDLRKRILDRLSIKSAKKRVLDAPIAPNQPFKKQKIEAKDVAGIKIKTLDEIRAEREAKKQNMEEEEAAIICDSSVTSSDDVERNKAPKNKIKLIRKDIVADEAKKGFEVGGDEEMELLGKSEENSENMGSCDDLLNQEDELMDESRDGDAAKNKTIDEVLLLQDDDDNDNVSIKDEERLLNDMDDLLED